MSRLLVMQSNYLPWKGYFDLIASVDRMILYDTAQFTKNDWRNRNRIKAPTGLKWLTVPVVTAGRFGQTIEQVDIQGHEWGARHLAQIDASYKDAPFYEDVRALVEPALTRGHSRLSELNFDLIQRVCEALSIKTPISWSNEYAHDGNASEKLLDLCKAVEATTYVSGPAAQGYLDTEMLARAGIDVEWFDYSGYREYPQRHGAFEHGVSIIDLLAEVGPGAREYLQCGCQ